MGGCMSNSKAQQHINIPVEQPNWPAAGSMAAFELFSRDGGIFTPEGQRVCIKGINWFGLETADFALHGLWSVNMAATLDTVAQHFNAIRMPFSAELALNMDARQPGNINYGVNPELHGLTTGQTVDRFVQECAKRGLLVMLDMHRLAAAGGIPDLWYDKEYPETAVLTAWRTIVLRYARCWHVFAADLNNEPHGCASWGDADMATDWRLAAERIGKVVLEANPRLLIFVEGVENHGIVQPQEACWWGGSVAAAAKAPVRLPVPNKLVYSPHVYGPDVHAQEYFSHRSFFANMPDIWHRHFGFVKANGLGPAICIGEWGGYAKAGSKDRVWQQAIAEWFAQTGITDTFYWCLNPNSGDTGGVLEDDWVTLNLDKLAVIATAHPNPTVWPRDEVTPTFPEPAAGQVPSSARVAAAPVAESAATGQPAPCLPAAVQEAAPGGVLFTSDMLAVREVKTWMEGSQTCFQLDMQVTNTKSVPIQDFRVLVTPSGELQQSWNCVQGSDVHGCWCFHFPAWVKGQAGGLVPGADVVFGIIVKGIRPTQFSYDLA